MPPGRIVCLTEEPTEVLYALGEEHRIVGISGFTVRPARARREKPRVSAFQTAKVDQIVALQPDLVVGFSDIQADIAQALIKRGVEVWISNHRTIAGIIGYVRRHGPSRRGDAFDHDCGGQTSFASESVFLLHERHHAATPGDE